MRFGDVPRRQALGHHGDESRPVGLRGQAGVPCNFKDVAAPAVEEQDSGVASAPPVSLYDGGMCRMYVLDSPPESIVWRKSPAACGRAGSQLVGVAAGLGVGITVGGAVRVGVAAGHEDQGDERCAL